MKYIIIVILAIQSFNVNAQSQELQQLILDIEKLTQFKQILSDMKKGYEILVVGYNSIRDIVKGNFNLHKDFLDGLMAVSPAVAKYAKIVDIISMQIQLVKEYKSAFNLFKKSNFSAADITYIGNVYSNLFDASLKDLSLLAGIITANRLRMSDDERLHAIDKVYDNMQDKLVFLRHFNSSTAILGIQKDNEQQDIDVIRKLYNQ